MTGKGGNISNSKDKVCMFAQIKGMVRKKPKAYELEIKSFFKWFDLLKLQGQLHT